jgi:hypothetical protein
VDAEYAVALSIFGQGSGVDRLQPAASRLPAHDPPAVPLDQAISIFDLAYDERVLGFNWLPIMEFVKQVSRVFLLRRAALLCGFKACGDTGSLPHRIVVGSPLTDAATLGVPCATMA